MDSKSLTVCTGHKVGWLCLLIHKSETLRYAHFKENKHSSFLQKELSPSGLLKAVRVGSLQRKGEKTQKCAELTPGSGKVLDFGGGGRLISAVRWLWALRRTWDVLLP